MNTCDLCSEFTQKLTDRARNENTHSLSSSSRMSPRRFFWTTWLLSSLQGVWSWLCRYFLRRRCCHPSTCLSSSRVVWAGSSCTPQLSWPPLAPSWDWCWPSPSPLSSFAPGPNGPRWGLRASARSSARPLCPPDTCCSWKSKIKYGIFLKQLLLRKTNPSSFSYFSKNERVHYPDVDIPKKSYSLPKVETDEADCWAQLRSTHQRPMVVVLSTVNVDDWHGWRNVHCSCLLVIPVEFPAGYRQEGQGGGKPKMKHHAVL